MRALSQAFNEFWLAWTFLSRLPAPVALQYSEGALNRSARFFPWVGLVLGALQAGVFWLALQVFGGVGIAVLVSVIAGLLLTGAFHEDGFADYCDSFGGHDVESRLAIMTDSRLGTFGVAGLVSILALRVGLLASLPSAMIPVAIVFAGAASRWLAISLMWGSDYVKARGKSKPLATGMTMPALLLAAVPIAGLTVFFPPFFLLICGAILSVFRLGFVRQLRQRLGGYTGDCLGAAQQIAEVLIYACLLVSLV